MELPFAESWKIKMVEPIRKSTREEREQWIKEAHYNVFQLKSEQVYIDLITDSGTGAMSDRQWAGMMLGDESYAGATSFFKLKEMITKLTGFEYIIPTHQGRAAENVLFSYLVHEGDIVPGNSHFDTTKGHIEGRHATALDCTIDAAKHTQLEIPFKGNVDPDKLQKALTEYAERIPFIIVTITNNTAGGQPVSMQNLHEVRAIADKYGKPVLFDSARFAENAYFIKQREAEYKDWTIEQITRETYKYADMLAMSAKKDAMVPMGGLLCMKDDSFFDVYTECRTLCVVQEGFPTYGGLEGGAMERLAVGLYDGMNLDWLAYRIAQVQYLVDGLEEIGVVCQQAGGHAAFVDAGKLLPHIPADQFPAQALACELYKVAGIRAVEIGSFLLGRDPKTGKQLPCPAELLRLTIPRATYTQTHMDFIIEAFKHVKENAANIKGLTFTYEPKVLRHFTAKLKEV